MDGNWLHEFFDFFGLDKVVGDDFSSRTAHRPWQEHIYDVSVHKVPETLVQIAKILPFTHKCKED